MPFDSAPIPIPYKFGLPTHTFAHLGKNVRGNSSQVVALPDLLDIVQELEEKWKMIDVIRPLSMAHIDFDQKTPIFSFRKESEIGQNCRITRHALNQMATHIQPTTPTGRGVSPFNLSEAVTLTDSRYRQIINDVWRELINDSTKRVMFRSKMIDGNRTITSIQGENYATVPDSTLLKEIQEDHPDAMVTGYTINSLVSNFRIIPESTGELDIKTLYPMWNFLNSDSGCRSLTAMKLLFQLICTNGTYSMQTLNHVRVRHYGNEQKVLNDFFGALDQINMKDDPIVALYALAQSIEIPDLVLPTLNHQLKQYGFTSKERDNAEIAFNAHPLISSPKNTIGHMFDAVTLSSQAYEPIRRSDIERSATTMLQRWVKMGQKDVNLLLPPVEETAA